MMKEPLARKIVRGDVQAAARLMRDLDDGVLSAAGALRELHARSGHAHVIGITGPPGSGKSTLAGALVDVARKKGLSVGVVAVDPTSPISGGAVLGDRIRMQRHAADKAVFIRSLATRGSVGGLSRAVFDTVTVMDAMGKDIVFIETAGIGQEGVKVAGAAHTLLAVCAPGMGDDIQALKAGVLEIADIFVANKRDREGSDELVRDLRSALGPKKSPEGWERPVIKTDALTGKGVGELAELIARHKKFLSKTRAWQKRSKSMAESAFMELLECGIRERVGEKLAKEKPWVRLLEDLGNRRTDPRSAARRALGKMFK